MLLLRLLVVRSRSQKVSLVGHALKPDFHAMHSNLQLFVIMLDHAHYVPLLQGLGMGDNMRAR